MSIDDADRTGDAGHETETDQPLEPAIPPALRSLLEWVFVLAVAIVIALLVRAFLFQSFWIKSGSMEDTLMIQDRVIVNRLSYQWGEPGTGDIVVFTRPEDSAAPVDDLIKRVIAVGGDVVEAQDGRVRLNGVELDEPYLSPGTTTADFGPVPVPDGHVWVMGDNRGNSSDSRVFGPVPLDDLAGRAFVRYWPLDRIGTP